MNNYLYRHKQSIVRTVLFAFVLSWFGLIGQASAHSFMMVEMQQHKAMGHDMSSHCQPVLCETVISLDDQTSHGLASVDILDYSDLPVLQVSVSVSDIFINRNRQLRYISVVEYDPPPLQKTGILRI